MENVQKIKITSEVAKELDLNPSYLIRIAKELKKDEVITENDLRLAGKRNYLFNQRAINDLRKKLNK